MGAAENGLSRAAQAGISIWHDLCKADNYYSVKVSSMHLFNRRPHEGNSSIIQIGEGMDVIEIEILEVVGEQVIVGVFAPGEVPVRRKEAVPARVEESAVNPPTVQ